MTERRKLAQRSYEAGAACGTTQIPKMPRPPRAARTGLSALYFAVWTLRLSLNASPDSTGKMEDVLETNEMPSNLAEPLICLDEKPVAPHANVRPATLAAPGRETRRDNEYERRGAANVSWVVEPKAGRHFTFATADRSGLEFRPSRGCWLASTRMQRPFIW